ncbi:hypothetical protein [Kribbella sp. NPDC006257]|uniref:hypothetical protein n=1 Tax=Kribbella sp. NPDC006257 TaxID=3156738 RepID=UPI0033BE8B64
MFPAFEFADCDAAETLARAAAAHELQRRSELELILSAQHFARLHPSPARVRDDGLPGGEQTRVYGGVGCPEIAEFAAAEFGAVIGRSAGSAAMFIGQSVALEYRFPLTWERVRAGDATGWKALQLAQDCVTLSLEAAAIVDRRVADIIDSVTLLQLKKIIKAASWDADPDAAKAKAEEMAKERGVWVGRTDDHGTTTLFIKAATGDVIQLDATIAQLAKALAALGDGASLDQRRAKAAGLLADPELAADLLAAAAQRLADTTQPTATAASAALLDAVDDGSGADDEADRDIPRPDPADQDPEDCDRTLDAAPPPAPIDDAAARQELRRTIDAARRDHPDRRRTYQTVVNLHITDETLLAGGGVARVEGYGPVYADRLEELLGHHRIVVRPVIDLNTAASVHAYEIPTHIREHIDLRYPVEQFPYGTGETTSSTDLDHIQPYTPESPTEQTTTDNLTPLRRFSHRLKTHGHWKVRRISKHTLEWTSPHGYIFHVDHNGTRRASHRTDPG